MVESFDDDDRDNVWDAIVRPLRPLDGLAAVFVLLRDPLVAGRRGTGRRGTEGKR